MCHFKSIYADMEQTRNKTVYVKIVYTQML